MRIIDRAPVILQPFLSAVSQKGSIRLTGSVMAPTFYGSDAANGDITIQGTPHATKTTSYVILQPDGGYVGIGTASPTRRLDIIGADAQGWGSIRLGSSAADNTDKYAIMLLPHYDIDEEPLYIFSAQSTNGNNDILFGGGGTVGNSANTIRFHTAANSVTTTGTERLRIDSTGLVGIGDAAPGTLLQLKGADAYLTLQNSTAENTDGGAETRIIFEDHANAALAQIQGSHDGAADDTKGDLIFSTHSGSALTERLRIDSAGLATFANAVKMTLSAYANNAAALAGGLTAGMLYRTGADPDAVCVVD